MAFFWSFSARCISHHSQAESFLCQSFKDKCAISEKKKVLSQRCFTVNSADASKRSFHSNCSPGKFLKSTLFDKRCKTKNYKMALPLHSSLLNNSTFEVQQPVGSVPDQQISPYSLVVDQLEHFYEDLRKILQQGTSLTELETIATYYFDGKGKAVRPMVTLLMSRAINYHLKKESSQILFKQRQIAIFCELIHAGGLLQDDVIDEAEFRRGKPSANVLWNHQKVFYASNYIFGVAAIINARLKNYDVGIILSKILIDVVVGELMQLEVMETEDNRFEHYLTKTYKKAASLIANSLKSTALIAGAEDQIAEIAFQYGRNLGLAHQLTDDMLDFVSTTEAMGKTTAADLKQGLATAPVLFACEKFPELNPMILRHFKEPGDVERAFELVHRSDGLEQTRFLAKKHCLEALRLAQEIDSSPYQKGLEVVSNFYINRIK